MIPESTSETATRAVASSPASRSAVPAPRPVVAAPTVIGVSVAIPEPWAGEIQDLRAAYGDPLARSIPTHVTLLPPTELPAEALPRIGEHLRRVAAGQSPFRMQLRGSGTFRPVSPVTYIRVDAGLRECRVLEAAVRAGPLARELAFPYHPHITVGHGLPDGVLARAERELRGYRAEFTVTAFSLYRFGADDVWRPMRAFELAAGAAY